MLETTQFYIDSDPEILQKSDVKKLGKVLQYHSDLYYNHDAPVISDTEYDNLLKKLEVIEEKYAITKNKASEKV
jgi:DNA ligase (NAD+)